MNILIILLMIIHAYYVCQPPEYDVRIVGGSRPSTGVVELYFNGKWGILCSTWWTIREADVVCRQSGYGGALINEGILSEDYQSGSTPIHRGQVNCTNPVSERSYHTIFGCPTKSLVTEEGGVCGWPNSVACTRHQAGKLFHMKCVFLIIY